VASVFTTRIGIWKRSGRNCDSRNIRGVNLSWGETVGPNPELHEDFDRAFFQLECLETLLWGDKKSTLFKRTPGFKQSFTHNDAYEVCKERKTHNSALILCEVG
jgi:hypothetical protein